MIYKKDASFPYPIYSNTSKDYNEPNFEFDIENLTENSQDFSFNVTFQLSSEFLNELYKNNRVRIVLIIQSKDNLARFIQYSGEETRISKNRLSFNERTKLQLQIISNAVIDFQNAFDLNDFYQEFKGEMSVLPNQILGYSDFINFDGSDSKPFDLFERNINPDLNHAFEVILAPSMIVLQFKDPNFEMGQLSSNKNFTNMYLYTGLSRALTQFILTNNPSEDKDDEIDIENLSVVSSALDQKLLDLMKKKGVTMLSFKNIDETIAIISDKMVERFVYAIEEVSNSGD